METFLVKSLNPEVTKEEVASPNIIRFKSFGSIVRDMMEEFDTDDELIGYRVMEQGIELVFRPAKD